MKTITDRLWNAIAEVAKLRHPSVAKILRAKGYNYEADRLEELVAAFDEMVRETPPEAGDDG